MNEWMNDNCNKVTHNKDQNRRVIVMKSLNDLNNIINSLLLVCLSLNLI